MPAPKKNQFWKQRTKHGRDKIFATPKIMLDAAFEYFDYVESNPWESDTEEYKESGAKTSDNGGSVQATETKTKKTETSTPFTITGLCIFLGVNTDYFNDFKKRLDLKIGIDKDFYEVIRQIENIIYEQKFQGAVVGAYNANIIARDLGISEKTDITSKGESIKSITAEDLINATELLKGKY